MIDYITGAGACVVIQRNNHVVICRNSCSCGRSAVHRTIAVSISSEGLFQIGNGNTASIAATLGFVTTRLSVGAIRILQIMLYRVIVGIDRKLRIEGNITSAGLRVVCDLSATGCRGVPSCKSIALLYGGVPGQRNCSTVIMRLCLNIALAVYCASISARIPGDGIRPPGIVQIDHARPIRQNCGGSYGSAAHLTIAVSKACVGLCQVRQRQRCASRTILRFRAIGRQRIG